MGMSKAKRHIAPDNFAAVLDRARNAEGHVCCGHCTHRIADDQLLTIQHIVPRRSLNEDSFATLARKLGIPPEEQAAHANDAPEAQQTYLRALLNAPDNLTPMHNACHREADFGLTYTPEEAAEINRLPQGQRSWNPDAPVGAPAPSFAPMAPLKPMAYTPPPVSEEAIALSKLVKKSDRGAVMKHIQTATVAAVAGCCTKLENDVQLWIRAIESPDTEKTERRKLLGRLNDLSPKLDMVRRYATRGDEGPSPAR